MSRAEFDKATKKAALKRAAGKCEAVGTWYGLKPGQRCEAPLGYGFDFDHIILDANSKDNSLENCACVCRPCHKIKTTKHDIPLAAKTVRQQDKHLGIRKRSTFSCSRDSRFKKKIDGTVVPRTATGGER